MLSLPKTLQGTDGLRGRIAENEILRGQHPLVEYLDFGVLTPAFFERYTYAFGRLLIDFDLANSGDNVVVGWDPRDTSGNFNQAAISGILKAGLHVLKIGVLPTPAIPLYMLHSSAAGSVVLTASHNPSDQNGIKLFTGHTGLKLLPRDDEKLTILISQQQALDIQSMPEKGQSFDHSDRARELFVSYHMDPVNSWIDDADFSNTILIIDASKGATSRVVEEIFLSFKFKEIIFTNMTGAINENCGVADIEGNERISPNDVLNQGARFGKYDTLQAMFRKAESENGVSTGEFKLTALVFDGDGDRCFRLDYDPIAGDLIVSSGDILGIHQAGYLASKPDSNIKNSIFVNTVESDLKTAISAEQLGYRSAITGVGDKWILLKAVTDKLRVETLSEEEKGMAVLKYLENVEQGTDLSALKMSMMWKEYLNTTEIASDTQHHFQLGIEESGHAISPGFIGVDGETVRCFAGNGIKSGLNSLLAVSKNLSGLKVSEWFEKLAQPYSPGVKETYYVYYVDKSRLLPGSKFRESLQSVLKSEVDNVFPPLYQSELVFFREEDSMIYCRISRGNMVVGAVFIRNSGTEDKSALYLRGEQEISSYLFRLGGKIHLYLLSGLKNRESEFTDFEIKLLKAVGQGQSIEGLLSANTDLPVDRMIKEIEQKEGLINRSDGNVQLTEKGNLFIEQW